MAEDQNRTFQDKFMLRMPEGMRDLLKSSAKKSGRSMNAEIVHRILQSYEDNTDMVATFKDADMKDLSLYLLKVLDDVQRLQKVIHHKVEESADNQFSFLDGDEDIPF